MNVVSISEGGEAAYWLDSPWSLSYAHNFGMYEELMTRRQGPDGIGCAGLLFLAAMLLFSLGLALQNPADGGSAALTTPSRRMRLTGSSVPTCPTRAEPVHGAPPGRPQGVRGVSPARRGGGGVVT